MERPASRMKRKKLFLKAKLTEKAKRYDHMVRFMREIVTAMSPEEDLSHMKRCHVAVAFKNIVSALRNAWTAISCSTQSFCGNEDDAATLVAAKEAFLTKMKTEITEVCKDLVGLINCRLLPTVIIDESKLLYLTLKAEFSCYCTEVRQDAEGIRQPLLANEAYGEASYIVSRLGALNPYRLALALSLAELFSGYLGKPGEARVYAEQALSESYRDLIDGPIFSISTFEGGPSVDGEARELEV